MAEKKHVHIIGAGLSGMVAAINLARQDYRVTMLDAAKSIGGVYPHHPSNHGTPINVELVKDYVGIDITPAINPGGGTGNIVINSHHFQSNMSGMYSVERGPRKTSIDTFLYEECKKLGVEFEFNQEIKDPFDLPDPTIIATGLFRNMYKALSRPALRLPCFSARHTISDPDQYSGGRGGGWWGKYSNTYGYSSNINGLGYYLLFSNRHLTLMDLKNFEEELEKSVGIKFDNWDYFEVFVPVCVPDAPQLFCGSKILAGTIAGMMDPMLYYGIHGAIVSGKVAALAVYDPETASKDFKHFTRNYNRALRSSRMIKASILRKIMYSNLRYPMISKLFSALTSFSAIPGIEEMPPGGKIQYAGRL